MKTHEFSIIASGLDRTADDFETKFFNAGCDDATVSFQKGHIILDFARDASSLQEAIASAIENVRKAGAEVDRVEPDPLVSLSEIASRTGLTKAAISLYAKGEREQHFPPPAARVTSTSPLWDWSEVARWMYKHDKIAKEEAINAEIVRFTNEAICNAQNHLGDKLKKRIAEYEKELAAA
jgi:predicted DNA-binding transcriptional regulator AlpA